MGSLGGSRRTTCIALAIAGGGNVWSEGVRGSSPPTTSNRYCRFAGGAGLEVAVWVADDSLTVEYGGEALSRYEVECEPATGVNAVGRLRKVKSHTLFETTIVPSQLRLFDLAEILGEEGWVKFLKLEEYAPRQARHPDELQQVLFSYGEEAV